jgi:hypothetical protein
MRFFALQKAFVAIKPHFSGTFPGGIRATSDLQFDCDGWGVAGR